MKSNKYKSGFEAKIAKQIERKGVEVCYETQTIKYVKPVTHHTYTPDFILPNGILVETKGRLTLYDRQKHMLIKEQHPELDIRFVFMNANNKIRKGSKTTYKMWAEKYGFKFAEKTIPNEWYKEKKL